MTSKSTDSNPTRPESIGAPHAALHDGPLRASIEGVVEEWFQSPGIRGRGASVEAILPMTPDASLRRYFRVKLLSPSSVAHSNEQLLSSGVVGDSFERLPESVVAMKFDSVACPEAGGGVTVDSDFAYVELSKFFAAHQVAVPRLLYDARSHALLLIEDLGDTQLIHLVRDPNAPHQTLFEQALQQIVRIQGIPREPGFFPFERFFSSELYIREMHELRDFILRPQGADATSVGIVEDLFLTLAAELDTYSKVLVHRDFHGWNLLIDQRGQVRVIDFQDALCATRAYDLVSLLNDRDMDSTLGTKLYTSLVLSFASQIGGGERFLREYDRVLLQRDLKVAGRFAKLVSGRGLLSYGDWIPGTLRRIGRTLERISSEEQSYLPALKTLSELLPDVASGAATPLRFV